MLGNCKQSSGHWVFWFAHHLPNYQGSAHGLHVKLGDAPLVSWSTLFGSMDWEPMSLSEVTINVAIAVYEGISDRDSDGTFLDGTEEIYVSLPPFSGNKGLEKKVFAVQYQDWRSICKAMDWLERRGIHFFGFLFPLASLHWVFARWANRTNDRR